MLLGRKRDVCARVLCASIHGLLYQLKMSKVIRQRFKFLDVPYDLKSILSDEIPDVAVSTNGGSSTSMPSTVNRRVKTRYFFFPLRNAS